MRIAVIGRSGQIARSLREEAAAFPGLVVHCLGRPETDLLRPAGLFDDLAAVRPDIVVNAAAYTAVDHAESEADLAFAINRDGAAAAAAAAAKLGAPIMHFSTDYVFDGEKDAAYVEADPTRPGNIYGRSKLEGEQAVITANDKHLIFRTAWVYAPFGRNFVATMLRLARERDEIRVVDDQTGCPTYAPDIAVALLTLIRNLPPGAWPRSRSGIYHLSGSDAMTWYEFARRIFAIARDRGESCPRLSPITTADYATPARRPRNSRLDASKLRDAFGITLPNVDNALHRCFARIAAPT